MKLLAQHFYTLLTVFILSSQRRVIRAKKVTLENQARRVQQAQLVHQVLKVSLVLVVFKANKALKVFKVLPVQQVLLQLLRLELRLLSQLALLLA
jgi:hypothetical protein